MRIRIHNTGGTRDRKQETGRETGWETGDGRQDRGDRTVVQETVDFVLRWDWETGERRQEKGDRR